MKKLITLTLFLIVFTFAKGNYILELQGDNTYLKSEHLMVY